MEKLFYFFPLFNSLFIIHICIATIHHLSSSDVLCSLYFQLRNNFYLTLSMHMCAHSDGFLPLCVGLRPKTERFYSCTKCHFLLSKLLLRLPRMKLQWLSSYFVTPSLLKILDVNTAIHWIKRVSLMNKTSHVCQHKYEGWLIGSWRNVWWVQFNNQINSMSEYAESVKLMFLLYFSFG